MKNQIDFYDPRGWLNFPEFIKRLGIPEEEIFVYLKRGELNPYKDIVRRKQMQCPEEHHEGHIKEIKKCGFEFILEDLPKFVAILNRVKSEKSVDCEKTKEFNDILNILMHKNPDDEQVFYSIIERDTFLFNTKNTSWITPEMIEKLEEDLKKDIKTLSNRLSYIKQDDPHYKEWKYLVGPRRVEESVLYDGVLRDPCMYSCFSVFNELWSDEDIVKILSELKECHFRKEQVENIVTPQKKIHWYLWDKNSRTLTILGQEEESLVFNELAAQVINLFDQVSNKLPPGKEYAELSIEMIRNTFATKDMDGNIINPGYKRDMGSFFQKQPWWKKILHTTPEVSVLRGIYRFAPPLLKK